MITINENEREVFEAYLKREESMTYGEFMSLSDEDKEPILEYFNRFDWSDLINR